MKQLTMIQFYKYKLFVISALSFLFGCMIAINLYPIEKTCQIDKNDREYSIMNNAKLKNPDLIIFILSAPKNLDRRNAIRETWLKLKIHYPDVNNENVKFKIKHYFVIGSLGLSIDEVLHLSSEQSLHGDMLILPIQDSYKNLTYKVLKSFTWLREQTDFGLGFKYVLKCDDDSFVRIDSLAQEIMQIEILYLKSEIDLNNLNANMSPYIKLNAQFNEKVASDKFNLYWGYFNGNAKIKTSGKWKENNWILCDNYIPYALGGGYIISKGLVKYLADNADNLRLYNSEDISVGAWLAPVNNVIRIHDIRFDTEWTTRGCQNYYLISHSHSIQQIKKLYQNIIETGFSSTTSRIPR
ncbi:PREDICTED: beta-1,3-galactosyltransferase 6 isoform X2 [Nicrophorus vespilloides]|uniref:Hexosyltransferase n=1 Tax=Nicrophorus vespilloides TaxID=110193 RepID=A0ABM1MT10_NICVS|nr:PREDICTED: beta-1,3-galactosyltransferase 6 isoform X2 [Nicrophorus vespilloides]